MEQESEIQYFRETYLGKIFGIIFIMLIIGIIFVLMAHYNDSIDDTILSVILIGMTTIAFAMIIYMENWIGN